MNELVILFLSLMVGWVIGIIPSLLLLRRLGIRQPNRNGAINREMMFEIDEEQLREIKDRYNIPGGTNQYFPLGHESGLGGLMVYFPHGVYGTKKQVAEHLRFGATPESIAAARAEVRELEYKLKELKKKSIASRKLQRFIYRPANEAAVTEQSTARQPFLSSVRSLGRRLVHAFQRYR